MTRGSLTLSGRVTSTVAPAVRLAAHVNPYIAALAAVVGKTKPFLSGFTAPSPSSANANCWITNVDFTAMPVWCNTAGGYTAAGRGCLITPIHHIQASHNGMAVGESFGFRGGDGTVYTRTVASRDRTIGYDIQINRLDSALPSAITPARMFAVGDVATYISSGDFSTGINSIAIDAELKIVSKKWVGADADANYLSITNATAANIVDFTETMIPGDSGSPNFIIVSGLPVLLTTNYQSEKSPAYHVHRAAIDAAIVSLGGSGTVTSVDLSGFTA